MEGSWEANTIIPSLSTKDKIILGSGRFPGATFVNKSLREEKRAKAGIWTDKVETEDLLSGWIEKKKRKKKREEGPWSE